MALNQTGVTIVGRLVSEPDYKRTLNDVDVTSFRLASNERRFDKASQSWVKGDTLFMDVTCWRRLAFNVGACLHKGDPVIVTGRLYTDEYEVDGKRRSHTRMEAAAVGPDLSLITAVTPPRKDKSEAGQDKAAGLVDGVVDGQVDGQVDGPAAPVGALMGGPVDGRGSLGIGSDFRPDLPPDFQRELERDLERDRDRKEELVPVG